ncbi:MAG: glycosyltransferase [Roseibacillus sp.]
MTITHSPQRRSPHPNTPNTTAPETSRTLSFVVPAPHHLATPKDLYKVVREQTERLEADWELLFIDHGRCEKTWLLIQNLVRDDPGHVRAYIFTESQNRSAALALGYREAKGDLVFSLESDQRDDPRELTRFLERIEWQSVGLEANESNGSNQRWQNILPRGVLRGAGLAA